MKTYARVEGGMIVEIIPALTYDAESPDWKEGDPSRIGQNIPIELRYTPNLVAEMFDISELDPQPQCRWAFDGTVFAPPVPYQPTQAEITADNKSQQAQCMAIASQAMAPILVSLQLGDATADEVVRAKSWQAYYRLLEAVDVSALMPDWPVSPN